jgi:hypothetical protein
MVRDDGLHAAVLFLSFACRRKRLHDWKVEKVCIFEQQYHDQPQQQQQQQIHSKS